MDSKHLMTREVIGEMVAIYVRFSCFATSSECTTTEYSMAPLSLLVDHCDGTVRGVEVLYDTRGTLENSHSQWITGLLSDWIPQETSRTLTSKLIEELERS